MLPGRYFPNLLTDTFKNAKSRNIRFFKSALMMLQHGFPFRLFDKKFILSKSQW